MSHIGKKKIKLPKEVKLTIQDNVIYFEGPLGKKTLKIDNDFLPCIDNSYITLKNNIDIQTLKGKALKNYKSNWGTYTILIKQKILGVYKGFNKQLNLVGVGFKCHIEEDSLILKLG